MTRSYLLVLSMMAVPVIYAGTADGPAPSKLEIRGDIKCRAVDDFPGRSQDSFGIGEDVRYWIDPPDREDPQAVIVWYAKGGTTYPSVGIGTLVSVDFTPGTLQVAARRCDTEPGDAAGVKDKIKGSKADLKKWSVEQIKALPKRQPEPPEKGVPGSIKISEALQIELRKMDDMRKGAATPLEEVDRLGKKLLDAHLDTNERGQIYYMLAHVHAQSGLINPRKVVEYARNALNHTLEAKQVPRMYVYWGDAVQVALAHEAKLPLLQRRKHAAIIYLAGLREVLRHALPVSVKDPPPLDRGLARDGDERVAKEAIAAYTAAQQMAYFQREMIQHRDVLTRQLGDLYLRRPPPDADELRLLAAEVLRDARSLERFMRAVKGSPWGE